ncbi:MAG: alpha/beta fold hydrolase [Acidimicrobiales bacterium]
MSDLAPPDIGPTPRTFPGARRPDRSWWVSSDGLRIAAYEWGPSEAPCIVMAHGGFDFAGTFDGFAPLLVDGGYRVVSWDARGHGCSEHAALYSWAADLRDAVAVIDSASPDVPVVFLGHSKGGGLMLDLAHAVPHRLTHLVNLDGLPSKNNWPDLADHERTKMLRGEIEGWLDHRRDVAGKSRKPGTIAELAERRQRMNPRLSIEWLEYLVTIGGIEDADGWRWRIDPTLRLGGFGPWRPEWSMQRLPGVGVPTLGVLGLEREVMGWGTLPRDVEPNRPPVFAFCALEDTGHFMHIEQPRRIADLVLDFLADHPSPDLRPGSAAPAQPPVPAARAGVAGAGAGGRAGAGPSAAPDGGAEARRIVPLRHGKVDLALHLLREGWGRPLLLLHGLGEHTPAEAPAATAAWQGPVYGLDLTGHGASSVPVGGGYTAEAIMADIDAAIAHLGSVTILGRGLGAYLALLIAGARPTQVHGIVLTDGPGLVGGGIRPGSPHIPAVAATDASPDAFVLSELSRDVRPPDYAIEYVRLIMEHAAPVAPIAVATVVRPEWLTAVVEQPGVVELPVDEALASFAS